MSIRAITVQYVGNVLFLPKLEREVSLIVERDYSGNEMRKFCPVRTCTLKHTRSGDDYYCFKCSNCGHEVGLHDINPAKCCYFFCNNCGAKVVER